MNEVERLKQQVVTLTAENERLARRLRNAEEEAELSAKVLNDLGEERDELKDRLAYYLGWLPSDPAEYCAVVQFATAHAFAEARKKMAESLRPFVEANSAQPAKDLEGQPKEAGRGA